MNSVQLIKIPAQAVFEDKKTINQRDIFSQSLLLPKFFQIVLSPYNFCFIIQSDIDPFRQAQKNLTSTYEITRWPFLSWV